MRVSLLEIPMNKIHVTLGDTAVCPYCGSSGGSTTAPSVTPAVRDAAEQMKAKLISGAAAVLEINEDDVAYSSVELISKKDQSKKITIPELFGKMDENVLVTTGARAANPEGYAINSFGTQFAKVEVDTGTGKVNVVKIVAAHDIGRLLNRKLMENQFEGGIIQGMSYALMEQRILDQNTGKVLNTNMHDYQLPTIMDIPDIEVIIVSDSDPKISNVGVKGLGEPPIIPTAGAIANAVYNAIGVRMKSLPITPDKILMVMKS